MEGAVSPLRVVVVPEFPEKLPPFLLRRGCGGQVGLVIHSACATDDTFRGPRSLKRSCPALRVVLVSGRPLAPQCSGLRERRGLSPRRGRRSPTRAGPFAPVAEWPCTHRVPATCARLSGRCRGTERRFESGRERHFTKTHRSGFRRKCTGDKYTVTAAGSPDFLHVKPEQQGRP